MNVSSFPIQLRYVVYVTISCQLHRRPYHKLQAVICNGNTAKACIDRDVGWYAALQVPTAIANGRFAGPVEKVVNLNQHDCMLDNVELNSNGSEIMSVQCTISGKIL